MNSAVRFWLAFGYNHSKILSVFSSALIRFRSPQFSFFCSLIIRIGNKCLSFWVNNYHSFAELTWSQKEDTNDWHKCTEREKRSWPSKTYAWSNLKILLSTSRTAQWISDSSIHSRQFVSFCGLFTFVAFPCLRLILHDRYRRFLKHVIKLNFFINSGSQTKRGNKAQAK